MGSNSASLLRDPDLIGSLPSLWGRSLFASHKRFRGSHIRCDGVPFVSANDVSHVRRWRRPLAHISSDTAWHRCIHRHDNTGLVDQPWRMDYDFYLAGRDRMLGWLLDFPVSTHRARREQRVTMRCTRSTASGVFKRRSQWPYSVISAVTRLRLCPLH